MFVEQNSETDGCSTPSTLTLMPIGAGAFHDWELYTLHSISVSRSTCCVVSHDASMLNPLRPFSTPLEPISIAEASMSRTKLAFAMHETVTVSPVLAEVVELMVRSDCPPPSSRTTMGVV